MRNRLTHLGVAIASAERAVFGVVTFASHLSITLSMSVDPSHRDLRLVLRELLT